MLPNTPRGVFHKGPMACYICVCVCVVSLGRVVLQEVVIIGGGAFACEAMRSAVWNGASSVTLLTREKSK